MSKKKEMIKCKHCGGKGEVPRPKYTYYECPECEKKSLLVHAGLGCRGRVKCEDHGIFRPEECKKI